MFGRDSSAIVGQPVYDLFADPDAFRQYLMSKKGQDPFEVPPVFEFLRADGRLFSAQVSFQKIYLRKQEFLGYVAVLRDVTQEKKVEKMKEDLIGMLTHDMSNPILSIQRVLEMLLDGHLGSLNASGSDLVPLALNCTNNLSGMVSNFLDIFLDECAGLNLCGVPGDMDTALTESLRLVAFPAGDKNISLHFQPGRAGLCFSADWSRLRRTCVNLLQNAIRFSPKGGAIFIDARVLAGESTTEEGAEPRRRVQVTIEDQGTGISPENQERIFEKFYTTSTRGDRTRRGVGLGLTFSKLVIEAHNGCIGVESPYRSESGDIVSGCRFRFDIPVANDDVYAVEGAEHDG
jgi:signal transduction histidine kinase